ncbi:class I SAM-dependent methyltransferase [Candidatus Gottesmanbacteria bacterium]|nr:class I SAM-dependent methyltransferase [Candidatus Gottesmanbacteria bacterium]
MKCLCTETKTKTLFQSGDYTIVECLACGQVRTESPAKVKRKNFYAAADIAVYIEKEEMFRVLFRRVISFIKRFISSGRFIDIGAGVGLLVDEAKKAGFDAIGFEPSKAAVVAAKKYFGIKLGSKMTNKKVDVVVMNHVLEHLENPKKLLSSVSCKFLFIGVPNFGSFLAQLKGGRWQSLIPDQHRWHFTLSTLDALVVPLGFVQVGATYENHDRSMHPLWKRPFYVILDTIALATGKGEAMLVAYKKI